MKLTLVNSCLGAAKASLVGKRDIVTIGTPHVIQASILVKIYTGNIQPLNFYKTE